MIILLLSLRLKQIIEEELASYQKERFLDVFVPFNHKFPHRKDAEDWLKILKMVYLGKEISAWTRENRARIDAFGIDLDEKKKKKKNVVAASVMVKAQAAKAILFVIGLKAAVGCRLVANMMANLVLNNRVKRPSRIAETLMIEPN